LRFGALIRLFAMGACVVHNYLNLDIGVALTIQQAVMCFVQWTFVGIAISLGPIYRHRLSLAANHSSKGDSHEGYTGAASNELSNCRSCRLRTGTHCSLDQFPGDIVC
jgi:hypothetical protein